MVESLAIWKTLAAEFGEGLGFRATGVLYLARREAEMAEFEAWLAHARAHGLDTVMQSGAQVRAAISGAAAPWLGGLLTPSDARAEPWVAVPLLAEGAARRGAVIVENCAVRRLDRAAGRICGVITEAGRVACDQVVVAGGGVVVLAAARRGGGHSAAIGAGLGGGDRTDGRGLCRQCGG